MLLVLKNPYNYPSLIKDGYEKGMKWSFDALEDRFSNKSMPLLSYQKKRSHRLREDLLWTVAGPFGFVPTYVGLSASLKLHNSLTYSFSDTLLIHLEQARHELLLNEWRSAVEVSHKALRVLEDFGWSEDSTSFFRSPVNVNFNPDPFSKALYRLSIINYIELLNSFPKRVTGYSGPPGDVPWSLDLD